jgi:hypothetical protein
MSSLPCKGTATVIVMSRGVPANTLTRVPGVCVCECVSGNLCLGALYNDLLWPWLSFYFTLFQSLPRFFRCCGVARNLPALSCVLRGVSPKFSGPILPQAVFPATIVRAHTVATRFPLCRLGSGRCLMATLTVNHNTPVVLR